MIDVHTMRELRDEERDQKLREAFTSGEGEDEEDEDWYDDEPELYDDNSLEARRDEMFPVSTHGTGGAFPRRRRGANYIDRS